MPGQTLEITLTSLDLKNKHAKTLQNLVLAKIRAGHPFQTHGNGLNRSWLAKELRISRQSFYPGRGSQELISLVELLNNHQQELQLISTRENSANQAAIRIRTKLMRMKEENENLKRRLLQLEQLKTSIHADSLLSDLTNEDLFYK